MPLNLKDHIREVPDHPRAGILFYDIGTLLAHGPAWRQTIDEMTELVEKARPEALLGIESRGFLVAAPVAARLGLGLIMVRKKGKLPGRVVSHDYALEYGRDTIEIQEGVIQKGQKTLVIDDLLATGGTSCAAIALARSCGARIVGAAYVIELSFLNGRKNLDVPVESLLTYAS